MFYLLDKPKGITSFSAIRKFAKDNNISKVGHTGTLDPLATGLLLVATDEDTKLIDYVDKGFKTYKATLELGKISDTYDIDGIVKEISKNIPKKNEIKEALLSFIGVQNQIPPIFSAKKINGKRAYELARKGKNIEIKPVKIEIKEIKNIIFKGNNVIFDIEVSRGTYIRSIIHDLGKKLGCGAIMSDLRRTSIGHLTEKDINKNILIKSLLSIPTIQISNMIDLINGKTVYAKNQNGIYALEYQNDILGIVQITENIARGVKLLGNKFRKAGIK